MRFDAVYTGPRQRQRDTAMLAQETAAGAIGEVVLVDALDEFPAFELLGVGIPQLARRSPAPASLVANPAEAASSSGADQILIGLLEAWIDGSLDTHGHETYAAFSARVRAAIAEIVAREGRGKRIAVFTSGGPIAQAVMMSLSLPDAKMITLANVITNASITELRYRDRDLSLATFNETPHLDAQHITHR